MPGSQASILCSQLPFDKFLHEILLGCGHPTMKKVLMYSKIFGLLGDQDCEVARVVGCLQSMLVMVAYCPTLLTIVNEL